MGKWFIWLVYCIYASESWELHSCSLLLYIIRKKFPIKPSTSSCWHWQLELNSPHSCYSIFSIQSFNLNLFSFSSSFNGSKALDSLTFIAHSFNKLKLLLKLHWAGRDVFMKFTRLCENHHYHHHSPPHHRNNTPATRGIKKVFLCSFFFVVSF